MAIVAALHRQRGERPARTDAHRGVVAVAGIAEHRRERRKLRSIGKRRFQRGDHQRGQARDQLQVADGLAFGELGDEVIGVGAGEHARERADGEVQAPPELFARQMRQGALERIEETLRDVGVVPVEKVVNEDGRIGIGAAEQA